MAAIREVTDMILRGATGDAALSVLKQTYKTLASLSTAMSHVRNAILDLDLRPDENDVTDLRALLDPSVVDAFLALPLREQYRVQRDHASRPTWSDDAERALARLRLLPRALDAFQLTRQDAVALKRKREEALVAKNERLIVVPDTRALLEGVAEALRTASPAHSYARLILPLLLASGRRLTEITNRASTFTPLPHAHHCVFDGQLKKKGRAAPYTIPLLVPYELFRHALSALREKQSAEPLTNAQAKARYQSNTARDLAKGGALRGMPAGCHTHDLRSTYLVLVCTLFVSPWTLPRTAQACLGHETMQESLSYQSVRLERADRLRGCLGPLALS